jgi:hypothetical protein
MDATVQRIKNFVYKKNEFEKGAGYGGKDN